MEGNHAHIYFNELPNICVRMFNYICVFYYKFFMNFPINLFLKVINYLTKDVSYIKGSVLYPFVHHAQATLPPPGFLN